MVIKGRDRNYEVIQKVVGAGPICHYRCLEHGEEMHLIQIIQGDQMALRILELLENPGFADLQESFTGEDGLYLVFLWPRGISIRQYLKDRGPQTLQWCHQIGQKVLERMLLLQLPEWMYQDVLNQDRVYLDGDSLSFYYTMEHAVPREKEQEKAGGESDLFPALLGEAGNSGRYPEIADFLQQEQNGKFQDVMEEYQVYMGLLPVCMEEREDTGKEKEAFLKRLKRYGKTIQKVFPLLMGGVALVAVVILLPSLWKQQVEPVLSAAALWKAVYVDGETLEAEENTTETPVEDPDQGMVIRYWDNGNVCYRGMVENGWYEGKGTLYYQNGAMWYQGEFAFGKKSGEGSLYTEDGILLYEGGFLKDRYEGEGKLYSDQNGNLIYEGGFSGGKYNGVGVIFDSWSEFPLYDGNFRLGFYDGEGVEYGSNGTPLYEGEFLLGIYHGHGIYYDIATGKVMAEGEFRNGNLVLPEPVASDSNAHLGDIGGGRDERTEDSLVVSEAG